MIERAIKEEISKRMFKGKIIVIVGPRQVGKTTFLKQMSNSTEKKTLFWNCDEPDIREMLTLPTSTQLKAEIGDAELILIDEAQRVKDIGITLKLLIDNFPERQFIVTGSSALDLSNTINEPLTGRKFEYVILPISSSELVNHFATTNEKRLLKRRLIYGSYPDIINNEGDEKIILQNLTSNYLYKDVFDYQEVRKPEIIERILQALALQIGSEISFNELGNLVGLSSQTVQRYIDLLEKSYILFHLRSYSANVRNELKKSIKIYFYDNGIRNALIGDFKPVELRNDIGALWENYLISERKKKNGYNGFYGNSYFWRTNQQQEIDYIEQIDNVLHTYEFKWNQKKQPKLTETFAKNYPNHTYTIINKENYLGFVL